MKKLSSLLFILLLFAVSASAQNMYKVTLNISAETGDDVKGLKVKLSNEEYGLEYPDATINASGVATFSNVVEGTNTLTIDGSKLGLQTYVDKNFIVDKNITTTIVLKEQTSTPFNIKYNAKHDAFSGKNKVSLSWNKEEPAFTDDFESYEPFAITFAPWTGIDGDKEPAAVLSGSYQNAGLLQYATIFNLMGLGDGFWYDYPVLRSHSGKQNLGFVRTASGNANNDWAVTPKLKIGRDFIVSFFAKASDRTKDRYNVLVSTKSNNKQSDFVSLTSGNYQTIGYESWEEITYSLKDYEGQEVYIAIQCVSQNSFMFMVDDFYVGPTTDAAASENPNETFTVYLDGSEVAKVKQPSFEFENLSGGKHSVGIRANYRTASSEVITKEIDLPADDTFADVSITVNTNNDLTPKELIFSIVNTVTGENFDSLSTVNKLEIASLPKGEYLVSVTAEGYQQAQKAFTVDKSENLIITLEEELAAPFGLTADTEVSDGTAEVTLRWNQTLGFTDGFETYEDFTQTFAPWTTLDLDKMPTYTMSIGGTNITVPEARATIGAMIFNPESTQPVKASEDALFIAPEGKKYVMFSSAEQGQSDDWLIAPSQTIYNGYVTRFTAKSYASAYPGTIEIGVVENNDPSTFQKVGSIVLTDEWMRYEVSLAAFAGSTKQVVFHHTSYDMWISMFDDVYIGPEKEEDVSKSSALSYDVFLDGTKVANTTDNAVILEEVPVGVHEFGVKAIYKTGESAITTMTLDITEPSAITAPTTQNPTLKTQNHTFNLNGQKVGPDYKGIIIRNGSKMLKK